MGAKVAQKKYPGALFTKFCEEWPVGPYWYLYDDDIPDVYDDGTMYTPEEALGLCLTWQGPRGEECPSRLMIGSLRVMVDRDSRTLSPVDCFRAWLKQKLEVTFVVVVRNDDVERFRDAMRASAWKVLP